MSMENNAERKIKGVFFDIGGTLISYANPKDFFNFINSKTGKKIIDVPPKMINDILETWFAYRKIAKEKLKEFTINEVFQTIFDKYNLDIPPERTKKIIKKTIYSFFSKTFFIPRS